MTIEIAPTEYWIQCTYPEALLYCTMLKIDGKVGWKIPTYKQYVDNDMFSYSCWLKAMNMLDTFWIDEIARCIPVRDIIDD